MKHLLLLVCIALSFSSYSQKLDLNQQLPADKSIRKGVLSNGMTYYIQKTDIVKNTASYYIIQNVGSILEEENQRGLAHFLEHMAFNGTEAFPKKALLNTLEEKGLVFGRDINAYTSFDETVYNVNKLGTTPEEIDLGLQILHDWSNSLTLEEAEIDAERGVIKEEWRTRDNGNMRVFQKNMPVTFGGSKYKDRMPIGLMNVVDNFKYQALRDFYHDWYRTDLQAIAIVGDIDVDDLEQRIKAKFSSIPAVKNPKERFYTKLKNNKALLYIMATDKEVGKSSIAFTIHYDRDNNKNTVAGLKDAIINNAVTSSLNRRLSRIAQETDAPLYYTGFSIEKLVPKHNSFGMYVSAKPNLQEDAFALSMNELNRAVKFGIVKPELDRSIKSIHSYYENQIAQLEDRRHGSLVSRIKEDYLDHKTPTDIIKEYAIVKQILAHLTVEDINKRLKELYTTQNRKLAITGVEAESNLTEAKALKIIKAAENNKKLKPYQEKEDTRSLMHGVTLKPGSIVNATENQELEFTTFTLSNGIRVHYKFTDKQKNQIQLIAKSKGGMSLHPVEDIPSSKLIKPVTSRSGLGAFTLPELQKQLSGKTARTNYNISQLSESIRGGSNTKDFETMLQLVNLRFTAPRFEESAYKLAIEAEKDDFISREKSLGFKKRDSSLVTMYGKNNPYTAFLNEESLKTVSLEKVKAIYNKRFKNPADFEFFIGGDIKKEELINGLEKYIASLPTTSNLEKWKDIFPNWISNTIDKDIFMPMENPKSTVQIHKRKEMPYSRKSSYTLSILKNILKLRFTESLREEEGGTYGASARTSFSKIPKEEANIMVSFDCNPDMVENLIKIVYNELDKIKNGTISQEDFNKVKLSMLKKRKEAKEKSAYDFNVMVKFVEDGLNADLPKNYENIINGITMEDIQNITAEILTDPKSSEIVFKPEIKQ